MTITRGRPHAGHTVLEMLVALSISAIVISLVGAIGYRQQRFHRDVVVAVERIEQLEQAVALMPVALRSISPADGDIPAGGARDTSLEFRATIATAIVCDSGHGTLVLAPTQTDRPRLASVLTRPGAGDTVWSLNLATTETWIPRPISAAIDTTTSCLIGGSPPWPGAPRTSLALRVVAPLGSGRGAPVRITRTWRYSIYRASDGGWYFGAKEWNSSTQRFNTIQPVAGPFVSATAGGLIFRYADSTGAPVPSGAIDTRSIALIEVAFRVDTVIPGKLSHPVGVHGTATAAVALRNRLR